jgi:glycosyltransferase involved in cell wall biosynthesis
MEPKVTVVMPAKNEGKFIKEAIESIIQQTYTNWELIIVDDKSTDNTREIACNYAEFDSRIKIINGDGIGVNAARNKVIDIANGKYIMIMDADDVSVQRRIELLVQIADKYQNIVVGSNVSFVDLTLNEVNCSKKPLDNKSIRAGFKRLFNRNTILPQTILITAGLLKQYRYNEFYKNLGDWDLILRLGENEKVHFQNIKEPLYKYRLNNGSISLNHKQRIKHNIFVRYNERQRMNGKDEITTVHEFEKIMKSGINYRIIYSIIYLLKRIQHSLQFCNRARR